MSAFY